MSEFAIPVVGALIFNADTELFLMPSSGKFGKQWIIPGGKVNGGEQMTVALRREIKEETNIELESLQIALPTMQLIEQYVTVSGEEFHLNVDVDEKIRRSTVL